MADLQQHENTCVVCFKNVLYYSIGECDHPVCFECSTRMRVLCLQNECPICRQDLSRVVFTDFIQLYKDLRNKVFSDRLFERQFKIGFCSDDIKKAYDQLLENRCKLCDKIPPFRTFTMLSEHMRKVHERYFCDLCVKHLKIFTNERKCYTRQELAHHRRKGDLDDTSHRGHPLCEFCEERFMDADELYRHLRKEHLYCHLCDADGRNLYYATHTALAHHFRTDHYLCEEGECAGQHLTAVFRSEIDLKAHKATVHGRGLARGAARQARTLELQFNITPHPVAQRAPRERAESPPPSAAAPPPAAARIDTGSDEHFPRLSAAQAAPNLILTAPHRSYKGSDGLARTDKNFPALEGGAGPSRAPPPQPTHTVAATIVRNSKPSVSIQLQGQPASASNFRLTQASGHRISAPAHQGPQQGGQGAGQGGQGAHRAQRRAPLDDDDFPSLGGGGGGGGGAGGATIPRDDHPSIGAATMQPPKVALINSQEMQALKNTQPSHQSKKPQLSSEAFPALSSVSAPSAPPQWITVTKNKEKQKVIKTEPPPKPRQLAFNAAADFPTLPQNNKTQNNNKVKKTAQPQNSTPAPSHDPPKPTKKEKKKQNSKKENIAEPPVVNGLDKKYARDPSFDPDGVNSEYNAVTDKKIKTVDTSQRVIASSEKNKNEGNGDFALKAKDYPPLSSRGENKVMNIPIKKMANGNVPAGFKARPTCDGMTFTNSAGQTFPAPVHTYIPPVDFEQRNRALVKKFQVALGNAAAVEDFKVASRAFRDSIISAEEFYQHCRMALGSQLDSVFSDLVALLPDIAKQQELVVGRDINLNVCGTCGQLISPEDGIAHDTAHWPPLAPR